MTENTNWRRWDEHPPAPGLKVVVLCWDGCTAIVGLAIEDEPGKIQLLDAEDGWKYTDSPLKNAIWTTIPDNYMLSFMLEEVR